MSRPMYGQVTPARRMVNTRIFASEAEIAQSHGEDVYGPIWSGIPNQRLAIVLDNLTTHANEAARKWLKSHPLVSFHYTPTHASWVNLIECFFSILTRQGLQQAVHQSGQELEHFLKSFIQEYNKRRGPFEWTKGPDKLRRIIELTEQWQSQ
jgi:transposase